MNQNGAIHLMLSVALSVVIGTSSKVINGTADLTYKELLQSYKFFRITNELDDYLSVKMNQFIDIKINSPDRLSSLGCHDNPEMKEEVYNEKKYQWKCYLVGQGRLERAEIQVYQDDFSRRGMAYLRPTIASVDSLPINAKLAEGSELVRGDVLFEDETIVLSSENSDIEVSSYNNHSLIFEGRGSYTFSKFSQNFSIATDSGQFIVTIKETQGPLYIKMNGLNLVFPLGEGSFFSVMNETANGIMALIDGGSLLHVDSGRFLSGSELWAIAMITNEAGTFYQIKSFLNNDTYSDSLLANKEKLLTLFNQLQIDETWFTFIDINSL
jgi:hypothetical protein